MDINPLDVAMMAQTPETTDKVIKKLRKATKICYATGGVILLITITVVGIVYALMKLDEKKLNGISNGSNSTDELNKKIDEKKKACLIVGIGGVILAALTCGIGTYINMRRLKLQRYSAARNLVNRVL